MVEFLFLGIRHKVGTIGFIVLPDTGDLRYHLEFQICPLGGDLKLSLHFRWNIRYTFQALRDFNPENKISFPNGYIPVKKILLVDDDQSCLLLLQEVLEERYVLALAHNGKEALEIAQSFNPDMVVLDIMMPGLDGFEVSRSLYESKASKNVKILFASALQLSYSKRIYVAEKGNGFILKPFDPDDLERQIEMMLYA